MENVIDGRERLDDSPIPGVGPILKTFIDFDSVFAIRSNGKNDITYMATLKGWEVVITDEPQSATDEDPLSLCLLQALQELYGEKKKATGWGGFSEWADQLMGVSQGAGLFLLCCGFAMALQWFWLLS